MYSFTFFSLFCLIPGNDQVHIDCTFLPPQTLLAKAVPVLGRLEEMAQLADRLAVQDGSEGPLERVTQINAAYSEAISEATHRLHLLEEAAAQYVAYANEVESVAHWMAQARQAFNAAQRAPSLREQLALQEVRRMLTALSFFTPGLRFFRPTADFCCFLGKIHHFWVIKRPRNGSEFSRGRL